MREISDIIKAFGGTVAFGRMLGHTTSGTAYRVTYDMLRRKSISIRHWPRIILEARRRRLPITAEVLILAHTGVDVRRRGVLRSLFSS